MLKTAWTLASETFSQWRADQAQRLAASLAYYTLFSLAPLLVIAVAIAGMIFGQNAARGEVFEHFSSFIGPQAARAVEGMIAAAGRRRSGLVATIIGLVVLLVGAMGVFAELHGSLNTVFGVRPKPGQDMRHFIRARLMSFAMVLGIGFLLLVSLILSAVISAAVSVLGHGASWEWVNFGISLAIITVLFAMIYKVLPDAKVAWRDVWIGAVLTSVLFTIGKFLLGQYLGRGTTTSIFGAAASVVVILVWVYYSAQILFLGAEFTQVYARQRGREVVPAEDAEPLRAAARQPGRAAEYVVVTGVVRHHADSGVARYIMLAVGFAVGRFLRLGPFARSPSGALPRGGSGPLARGTPRERAGVRVTSHTSGPRLAASQGTASAATCPFREAASVGAAEAVPVAWVKSGSS